MTSNRLVTSMDVFTSYTCIYRGSKLQFSFSMYLGIDPNIAYPNEVLAHDRERPWGERESVSSRGKSFSLSIIAYKYFAFATQKLVPETSMEFFCEMTRGDSRAGCFDFNQSGTKLKWLVIVILRIFLHEICFRHFFLKIENQICMCSECNGILGSVLLKFHLPRATRFHNARGRGIRFILWSLQWWNWVCTHQMFHEYDMKVKNVDERSAVSFF